MGTVHRISISAQTHPWKDVSPKYCVHFLIGRLLGHGIQVEGRAGRTYKTYRYKSTEKSLKVRWHAFAKRRLTVISQSWICTLTPLPRGVVPVPADVRQLLLFINFHRRGPVQFQSCDWCLFFMQLRWFDVTSMPSFSGIWNGVFALKSTQTPSAADCQGAFALKSTPTASASRTSHVHMSEETRAAASMLAVKSLDMVASMWPRRDSNVKNEYILQTIWKTARPSAWICSCRRQHQHFLIFPIAKL